MSALPCGVCGAPDIFVYDEENDTFTPCHVPREGDFVAIAFYPCCGCGLLQVGDVDTSPWKHWCKGCYAAIFHHSSAH